MAVTPYKTLGTLRANLLARLGFGASGASAGVAVAHLNNVLQEQQYLLYNLHDWVRLKRYTDVTVGLHQNLIDYPDEANPERIKAISINLGTDDGPAWSPPIKRGITPSMYTSQANYGPPTRWEPYAQIELYPKADRVYAARIFYIKNLDRFEQDGDVASIDDSAIFTLALGITKAHYRQPDAKIHIDNATALMNSLKAKSWSKDVFSPYDFACEPLPRPVVV